MKKLDLVPCPYVNDQYIQTTELLCDIQECNTCPMRFRYVQLEFKETLTLTELLCDIQECNTCPIRFRYDQLEFKETLTLGKEKVM